MSSSQRDVMLEDMRTSAQAAIDGMVADTSNSITNVDFNGEMTSFRVSVDSSQFSQMESFYALAFYIQGALFQQFQGVEHDDIDVIVDFVDDASGEVLQTGS